MSRALVISGCIVLTACGSRGPAPAPTAFASSSASTASTAVASSPSQAVPRASASTPAAPAVTVPRSQPGFTPDRACTTGPGKLVLENDCGCDRTMTCDVSVRGAELYLVVHARQTVCKDCAPHTRVTCEVPAPSAATAYRVLLDGAPLLERLAVAPDRTLGLAACAPLP